MTMDFSTTAASVSGGSLVSSAPILIELGISEATATELAVIAAAIRKVEGAIARYLHFDPVLRTRTEYYPQRQSSPGPSVAIWEANETQAYVRRQSSANSTELQLKHIPVRSISSLYIDFDGRFGTQDDAFADETEKTEGTDFWPVYDLVDGDGAKVCSDGILRSIGLWPDEPGSVKVTYQSGFKEAELLGTSSIIDASPIYEAAIEEAARYARRILVRSRSDRLGHTAGILTSENLGDYSYTLDVSQTSDEFSMNWDLMASTRQKLAEFVHYGFAL